jgi:hypothetical protein
VATTVSITLPTTIHAVRATAQNSCSASVDGVDCAKSVDGQCCDRWLCLDDDKKNGNAAM